MLNKLFKNGMSDGEKISVCKDNLYAVLLKSGMSVVGIKDTDRNVFTNCLATKQVPMGMGMAMAMFCPLDCGITNLKDGTTINVEFSEEDSHYVLPANELMDTLPEGVNAEEDPLTGMVKAYLQNFNVIKAPAPQQQEQEQGLPEGVNMEDILANLQNQSSQEPEGAKDAVKGSNVMLPTPKKRKKEEK